MTGGAGVGSDIGAVNDQDPFRELSADECRGLLSTAIVGRVAWISPDGLRLLPINFRWDDGQLVFRTSPYGELAQLVRRQPVAFEADDIDVASRTGWSVVVHGEAAGLKQSPRLLDLWRRDVVKTWVAGSQPTFIAIDPLTITGRHLRPDIERTSDAASA